MTSIAPAIVRWFLAAALISGGLPAWGMDGMAAVADDAIAVEPGASGHDAPDCLDADDGAMAETDSQAESNHDCCDSDEVCEHNDCRCLCPAPTLVIPAPADAASVLAHGHRRSALKLASPRNAVSPLLRPPRA